MHCDEHGRFSFSVSNNIKAINIWCVGYEKREFTLTKTKDSLIIVLQRKHYQMEAAHIKAPKGNVKTGVLGKKNIDNKMLGYDCWASSRYGREMALFLPANTKRNGVLKEVFFYVTDRGIPKTKFRIHVYAYDSVKRAPGIELTTQNIVVHADTGNEWVNADLSNMNIPLGKGIFISAEWIEGHDNDPKLWSISGSHAQGQVLGLTKDYWNYGYITFDRKIFETEWDWAPYPSAQKRHVLNLMAYATYRYIK